MNDTDSDSDSDDRVPRIGPDDIIALLAAPHTAALCVVEQDGELSLTIDVSGYAAHHSVFLTRETALDAITPADPHRLDADDLAYIGDEFVPSSQEFLARHVHTHFPDDHADDIDDEADDEDEGTVWIPLVSLTDDEIDDEIEDGASVVSFTRHGERVTGVLVGRDEIGADVRIRTDPDTEIEVSRQLTRLPHS